MGFIKFKKILVFADGVDNVLAYFLDIKMGSRKNKHRKIRRPFETGLVVIVKLFIPLLPRCSIIGLSRLAGRLGILIPSRARTIGFKNLDAVFGSTKSEIEKRTILKNSFATFSLTMLDVFWFSRHSENRIKKYVYFKEDPLVDSFFENKPIICITAHMGSWEIMGQTCALMGADMASIAATVKNRSIDRILIKQREKTGQTIIPQKGALKTLIARFRKNGKAAFVLDQNTPIREGGIMVDFLGLPMPVSPAPAAMAYRTGTEIMLGFCLQQPNGKYCIEVTKSILPPAFDKALNADAVALELTQQIQTGITEQIRAFPGAWLWSYKHWRRKKNGVYPANYPTY